MLGFIKDNKDKFFFLFLFSIILYVELIVFVEIMDKYIGKFELEMVYEGYDEGLKYWRGFYEL